MNRHTLLNIAATAIGLAALAGSAVGQEPGEHKLISPQDIKWGPAPPSVPAGAQAAVLYGDPGKDGLFAFRLKVPKGLIWACRTFIDSFGRAEPSLLQNTRLSSNEANPLSRSRN